jgi:hypothetical protein
MPDPQKITMGKVRLAYALNDHETEALMAAIWPHGVFPLELWRSAYEKYWRGFAERNTTLYHVDSPAFPGTDSAKEQYLYTHIYAHDISNLFKSLAARVHAHALREGLKYIFAITYEDSVEGALAEETDFLFNSLAAVEKNSHFQHYMVVNTDEFIGIMEEKILAVPPASYDFIARIFPNTILVDTVAAIRQLHAFHYPLRREVKGITRNLVDAVTNSSASETLPTPETATPPAEPAAAEQPQDQKPVFRVPAALWERKSDAAVRDAMQAEYPLSVIAYVLVNWCGAGKAQEGHKTPVGRKTHVGRLLAEKEYKDDKSYRNFVDPLLKEADSYTIVRA